MSGSRRGQAGFSLAEVVVALGVLASVLISVAGMLVLANRIVRAGRGSSEALALARDFMEEMHGWGFRQTFSGLGCDETATDCELAAYADPSLASDAALAPWKAMLHGDLNGGSAEVRVESIDAGVPLGQSQAVRVTVTVRWKQDQRERHLTVGTVRM